MFGEDRERGVENPLSACAASFLDVCHGETRQKPTDQSVG
jgi:hypothetical protein